MSLRKLSFLVYDTAINLTSRKPIAMLIGTSLPPKPTSKPTHPSTLLFYLHPDPPHLPNSPPHLYHFSALWIVCIIVIFNMHLLTYCFFDLYHTVLQSLADDFTPVQKVTVRRQRIAVWFDNECRWLRRYSRLLERRFHVSNLQVIGNCGSGMNRSDTRSIGTRRLIGIISLKISRLSQRSSGIPCQHSSVRVLPRSLAPIF